MKIRHISIRNFRGIKVLDWCVKGDLLCLIGACDATKSTILDAIEYVLFPKWNISFEDSDFYNLDVTNNIAIDISVGQLPVEFLSEQKFGLCLRGWNENSGLKDEPEDEDELVLTVSLQIAKDLEPKWMIKNNRLQEEKRISASDRSALGMTRLGVYADRHLSWATGSILAGMTGENININDILAEAARKIRNEVDLHALQDIAKAVSDAEQLGKNLGVTPKNSLKAHIDLKRVSIKESGVALHDGNVPLRLSGTGTQRLMGLALQLNLIKHGGINLIDEIEYGLEPHRIYQILKLLQQNISSQGQIFLTTHSPSVLQELDIKSLKLVFSEKGTTTIKDFNDDEQFQKLMRSSPSAFLAKRIIVCEGKTEQGILRGVDDKWQTENKQGMWSYGVTSVDGNGENSFDTAKQFHSLKYNVIWWGDSDVDAHNEKKQTLIKESIPVVQWDNKCNLEGRLFTDLPWEAIKELIDIAVTLHGQQSVIDQVISVKNTIPNSFNEWADSNDMRSALSIAAHKKEWFKTISYAEKVGEVVAKYLDKIEDKDLSKKISAIRSWIETGKYCSSSTGVK